jgi:hypothetical protein
MREAWGVPLATTTGYAEGITVIELFATKDLAIAFRDGYATNRFDRIYSVTKFVIWDGPIRPIIPTKEREGEKK